MHETPEGAPVFTPNTDLAKEFKELEPKQGEKVRLQSRVMFFNWIAYISSCANGDTGDWKETTGRIHGYDPA